MSEVFTTEVQEDVVVIRVAADVDAQVLVDTLDDILAATNHFRRRLWDLSGGISFSRQEIEEVAQKGRLWPAPAKVAYVGADDLTYGLSRMFEVYSEREGFDTRVFRVEQDALDWLQT